MSAVRADLVALGDDALAQLGNAGILKRALREEAAGAGPVLAARDDGALTALFADGTLVVLPVGKTIDAASCTCPSSGFCRHRMALAVAYRSRHADAGIEEAAPAAGSWDPGSIDPEAYEAVLPVRTREAVARILRERFEVRLEHGSVPAAHLPTAVVRFLVPGEVGYARCDCAHGPGCVHVPLAVRAFRQASGAGSTMLGGNAAPVIGPDVDDGLGGVVDAVLVRLIEVGVVAGPEAHVGTIGNARRVAETAGATQIILCLDDLSDQISAYAARSSRHSEGRVLSLVVELFARTRADDRKSVLGIGQPMETAMGRMRLVSLGARLSRRDTGIEARVLLADSDTGAVLLLDKTWMPEEDAKPLKRVDVAGRLVGAGCSLEATAGGQILTSVARRRADGRLSLGAAHGGRTSVFAGDGRTNLPAPLAAATVDAVLRRMDERPLPFVRRREIAGDVHVFEVDEILGHGFADAGQTWRGAVSLAAGGGVVHLERTYDDAAPGAVEVLAAAFDGRYGDVHRFAGTVRLVDGLVVVDPWSVTASRLIVPDMEADLPQSSSGTLVELEMQDGAVGTMRSVLAGVLHAGRTRTVASAVNDGRRKDPGQSLRQAGYAIAARLWSEWSSAPSNDVEAFGRAATWVVTLDGDR